MRKFLFILISLSSLVASAQRTWDQPVQIQSCKISVEANLFVAKTVIELEFYNPNSNTVEGVKNFKLDTGLAITGFELELNGKYRKGSIEQSSKAAAAYNAIVGKRIDPALLQMTGENYYTLRIFPFDPKGTRKIRFTVHQLMKSKKDAVAYDFPLAFTDTIRKFTTTVRASGISLPPRDPGGIITEAFFHFNGSEANLLYERRNIIANQPILFELPIGQASLTCFGKKQETTHFATRYLPTISPSYGINAKTLTVFWDVSASGSQRQVDKEINFLKQYVALHKPSSIEIVSFNYKIRNRANFTSGDRSWISYLKNIVYDGGTQIGSIDLSQVKSEVVLIFSDGINGYGNAHPRPGSSYVFSLHATNSVNRELLKQITQPTGGTDIDLLTTNLSEAVKTASIARVNLVDIYSASGHTIIDSSTTTANGVVFIGGTTEVNSDTLLLVYGNSVRESVTARIAMNQSNGCQDSSIALMKTISDFTSHVARRDYTNDFGLREKIVTYTTAYIVLERIEDYVRYGIEPPDEILAECIEAGYVKKNVEQQLAIDQVAAVTNQFNSRNAMAEAKTPVSEKQFRTATGTVSDRADMMSAPPAADALEEVVVTSLGIQRKREEVGYSTARISGAELTRSKTFNLADAMTGKVSGLVIQHNTADVNAKPKINLRGLRSLTGNNSPLIVLDGVPVKESVIHSINPNDVNTITVLKGGQAATLFGSEGVNGAIVIEMKKGVNSYRNNSTRQYKLSAMEDVDYLSAIKETSKTEKRARYEQLKKVYQDDAGFYIDMADHFHSVRLEDDAFEILTNAIEKSNGNVFILNAVAYTLETWKWYDSANVVLNGREHQKISAKRAIAWNLYRSGNPDLAIKMLYELIETKDQSTNVYNSIAWKAFLLGELNSMIHSANMPVNISYIRKEWIRPQTADIRITVEMNNGGYLPVSIVEPGSTTASMGVTSKNGGIAKYEYLHDAYLTDYILPAAAKGKYRINVHYNSNGWSTQMGKITIYRNYGRKNQTIETQSFILDNQAGTIEIASLKI
jgi:hypothetical protein